MTKIWNPCKTAEQCSRLCSTELLAVCGHEKLGAVCSNAQLKPRVQLNIQQQCCAAWHVDLLHLKTLDFFFFLASYY